MIFQLGNSTLQTSDKELAERWTIPELRYSELEIALSFNYTYEFISCYKRCRKKERKFLIYKSKIMQIEKWWYFENKESQNEIECLFVNNDGMIESQFFWSTNRPSSLDMIEAGKKGHVGSVFVQSSTLTGHSEYLDECFFTKDEQIKYIQHEFNNGKMPKLTHKEKYLKQRLSERNRWLYANRASVNVSYIVKKEHLKAYSNSMRTFARHNVKYSPRNVFENNHII